MVAPQTASVPSYVRSNRRATITCNTASARIVPATQPVTHGKKRINRRRPARAAARNPQAAEAALRHVKTFSAWRHRVRDQGHDEDDRRAAAPQVPSPRAHGAARGRWTGPEALRIVIIAIRISALAQSAEGLPQNGSIGRASLLYAAFQRSIPCRSWFLQSFWRAARARLDGEPVRGYPRPVALRRWSCPRRHVITSHQTLNARIAAVNGAIHFLPSSNTHLAGGCRSATAAA